MKPKELLNKTTRKINKMKKLKQKLKKVLKNPKAKLQNLKNKLKWKLKKNNLNKSLNPKSPKRNQSLKKNQLRNQK